MRGHRGRLVQREGRLEAGQAATARHREQVARRCVGLQRLLVAAAATVLPQAARDGAPCGRGVRVVREGLAQLKRQLQPHRRRCLHVDTPEAAARIGALEAAAHQHVDDVANVEEGVPVALWHPGHHIPHQVPEQQP